MVSYIIIVACGLILGGMGIYNSIKNQEVAEFATVTLTERYGRIHRTVDAYFYLQLTLEQVIEGKLGWNEHKAALTAGIQELDTAQTALQMARYPTEIGRIKEASIKYIDLFRNRLAPALDSHNLYLAKDVLDTQMVPLYYTSTTNLDTVIGYQINRVHTSTSTIASMTPLCVTTAVSIITVLLSLFFAITLPRYLIGHIDSLKQAASKIAAGDLGTPAVNTSGDELGEVMDSIENMRVLWRDRISAIIESARAAIGDSNRIQDVTKGIFTSANQVQERSLTVAAASDELVSTTADIARNCENAAGVANDSVSITNQGVSQVEDTISTMLRQVDKTKTDVSHIQALAEQTQKIGSIIGTIDEIASQTNLLALNAAIEAARAGNFGRGFAVVADEVRALASRTSSSTQEISKMVKQVQEDANTANNSMVSTLESMTDLASKAGQVQQILRDIIDHVNDVNSRLNQITDATEQQAKATSEISENMRSITDAAEAFVSSIGQVQTEVSHSMDNIGSLLEQVRESERSL